MVSSLELSLGPRHCCSSCHPCGPGPCSIVPSLPTPRAQHWGTEPSQGFWRYRVLHLEVQGASSALGQGCPCGRGRSGEGGQRGPGTRSAWLGPSFLVISASLEPALPPGPAFAATSSPACPARVRIHSQPGAANLCWSPAQQCHGPWGQVSKAKPAFWLCSVGLVPLCCIQCCH